MSELTNPTRAGEYDRRVVIQQKVAGSPQQLATGEPDEAWATVCTVWARVTPNLGSERFVADQIKSAVDARVSIRYRAGIEAGMRVVMGSQILNIDAVVDVQQAHVELLLLCTTGLNEG